MLDVLLSPQILGLLFLALVIVGVILVIIRRRRRAQGQEGAPPSDIGQPIDYTSMAVEESTSLADRIRNAPPAVKALIILAPLVVIAGLIAMALALTTPPNPSVSGLTPETQYTLSITRAEVAGNGKIVVIGETSLPNSATVTAELREEGEQFPWYNPDTAVTQPVDGKVTLTLDRSEGAPVPSGDRGYTIVLAGTIDGRTVNSNEQNLFVSPAYASDFFQAVVAVPTVPPAPTDEPSTPAPTSEPTVVPVVEPTGTAIGGGKIRREPSVQGEEIGTVTKGEQLVLLERTQDGAWYRVRSADGEGWVSSTLLEVAPEVAAQVPTPQTGSNLTTTVFNGGNVRPGPGLSFNPPIDQINAGETVQLLAKTADEQWFQITNIRGKTGWVNRTLLNLSVELIREVPLQGSNGQTQPTTPTGLTARVSNGGNVRPGPGLSFNPPIDQINAGETVQLLAKSADGRWFQITNIRSKTGWVSVTLLTIDPDIARRVPVGQ